MQKFYRFNDGTFVQAETFEQAKKNQNCTHPVRKGK